MGAGERGTGSADRQDVRRETPSPRTYSRRAALRAALGMAGVAALAACGGASSTPATGGGSTPAATSGAVGLPATGTAPAARATTTTASLTTGAARATAAATRAGGAGTAAAGSPVAVDGTIPGGDPNVPDAYLKPPTPFKSVAAAPARGGRVTTFQIQETAPVPGRAENRYWQELERRVGATIEPTWAPTSSWGEKFATLTAGGEFPDLCWLLPTDPRGAAQNRTLQQGAFTDLTPYLTGDALKEYPNLAAFPPQLWKNVAIDKKIYGVPRPTLSGTVLVFRRDWMEKVGMTQPRNAAEMLQLLVAVTKGDPDGNGRADTYGLGQAANQFSFGFMQQMFRAPNGWRRNPDGSLTNTIETAEHKAAVAFARGVWEAGAYHPETPTMTVAQSRTGFDAGQFAGFHGAFTAVTGRRAGARLVNPAADVIGLPPPGHDGGKGVAHTGSGFSGFAAIPSRVGRDRERVKELLRVLDWYAAPFGSEEWIFKQYGLEGVHHTLRPDGTRGRTELGTREIGDLPNLSNNPPVFYYSEEPNLAPAMQGLYRELLAIGVGNPVGGLFSPTEVAKGSELTQLGNDRLAAFVTGREPLSGLDAYIRDWRSRGGDQIRREYEEALKGQ